MGEYNPAAREAALEDPLQVQEAEVIVSALADLVLDGDVRSAAGQQLIAQQAVSVLTETGRRGKHEAASVVDGLHPVVRQKLAALLIAGRTAQVAATVRERRQAEEIVARTPGLD